MSHLANKHLENPKAYAWISFADFSSAFDTVSPILLVQKLTDMQVSPSLINWFYSLLINRVQQVKVLNVLSHARSCSAGVPQGSVSSPILFNLYINESRAKQSKKYIIKFSDDT